MERPVSSGQSAKQLGLVSCHCCLQLSQAPPPGQAARCPRCHEPLHSRKHNSLSQSWALLITAYVLYLPANLLPIMRFSILGKGQPATILEGVQQLTHAGMWGLAAVVFIASVVVPVGKLLSLTYLLLSVQRGSRLQLKDRTRLYRLTEMVGRWSMVDVFVVAILVALVHFGTLAQVEPGWGITCFGAVVITTMWAAERFDPRLMWDCLEKTPNES